MPQMAKVNCPLCSKILYQTGLLDDRGVSGLSEDSPAVESDESGNYMFCPHCHGKVKLKVVKGVVGSAFEVAGNN